MKGIYKYAAKFGLSGNTAKKYLRDLQDTGLSFETSYGIHIAKLSDCIRVLMMETGDDNEFYSFRHIRFFKEYRNAKTVKDFQQLIEYAFLKRSVSQQLYNSEKIDTAYKIFKGMTVSLSGKAKNRFLNNMLKKKGFKSYEELKNYVYSQARYSLNNAVTGRFHLSNLIGCSPSTAAKRLSLWDKNNLIKRKIVAIDTKEYITHDNFDMFKGKGLFVIPCFKRNTFITLLGSKVSISPIYCRESIFTECSFKPHSLK